MPIPKPKENEDKKDFLKRCMADSVMRNEFKDQPMRYAVCNTQWDQKQNKD